MIDIRVMAHRDRSGAVGRLERLTGARTVWDRGRGENDTGDRAWALPAARGVEWVVVLQDDALPVPAFRSQLAAALTVAPSPVVSLYLGTGYPERIQGRLERTVADAEAGDASWIVAPALFWGVGVAVRVDLVPKMIMSVRRSKSPYDTRLSQWCRADGHSVSYTWPSLVDHADGRSMINNRPRTLPRVAHRAGRRDEWSTRSTRL